MGWLWDAIVSVFNWIMDTILRPFFTWLSDSIAWLVAEVKYWTYEGVKLVAKWMQNDLFFLFAIAALIVGIVFLPKITAWLAKLKTAVLSSAIVKQIKEIGSLIGLAELAVNLETLHLMFKTFWPDYRALMASFSDAMSGVAEILGQGTGFLHAYANLARSLAMSTASVLGLSAEQAEIEAYQAFSDQMKTIDARMRAYMHDPGLVMRDLIEEVILPLADKNTDAQQGLVEDVRSNHDNLVVAHRNISEVNRSVDTFIASLPDIMQQQFLKRWLPVRDWIQERLDFIEDELIFKTNQILEIFELRVTRAEQIAEIVQAKQADPISGVLAAFRLPESYQRDYEDLMSEVSTETLMRRGMLYGDISRSYGERKDIIDYQFYRDLIDIPALSFEERVSARGISLVDINIPSPFVGEY